MGSGRVCANLREDRHKLGLLIARMISPPISACSIRSKIQLRTQFKDMRIQWREIEIDRTVIGMRSYVVRLELKMLAQIPVEAQRPVVLPATLHRPVAQVQLAVARGQLDCPVALCRVNIRINCI